MTNLYIDPNDLGFIEETERPRIVIPIPGEDPAGDVVGHDVVDPNAETPISVTVIGTDPGGAPDGDEIGVERAPTFTFFQRIERFFNINKTYILLLIVVLVVVYVVNKSR